MFRRCEFHDRARRSHRAGRRERRRQIDADQAAGPHRTADAPANTRWDTTCCPIISRRISTRSSIRTRASSTIWANCRPRSTQTELRSLLGCFLFSEDDVFKRIGVLSGGERNRYALLAMLLHPANFLLLDEPTNHLDMRAKDVLLDALKKYTGTVVFVSHDRYFIDKLATRVFEIGEGKVEIFPGNYEDYLWRKQGGQRVAPTLADVPGVSAPKVASPAATANVPKNGHGGEVPTPDTAKKRLNPIKRKQLEDRIHELEEEIGQRGERNRDIETAMQNFVSADESQRQSLELDQQKASHAAKIREWEDLSATLQASE